MVRIVPFHTESQNYEPKHRKVFHDKSTCPEGKRIEKKHRQLGTGGKKHCPECEKAT